MRATIFLLLISTLACGSGGSGGLIQPPPPPPPSGGNLPSPNAQVAMTSSADGYSHSFIPSAVILTRGGTVTWSNTSGVAHNVTFTTAGAPANIPNLLTGNATRTFPNAGTFGYRCTNHAGMEGEVTVQ
jgi:plastocyanin